MNNEKFIIDLLKAYHNGWNIENEKKEILSRMCPQWISVKDSLPDESRHLFIGDAGTKTVVRGMKVYSLFEKKYVWQYGNRQCDISYFTHWMYNDLPQPPEE